jgi:energy-coupling factor transporter ATP-binding protein EcfA2
LTVLQEILEWSQERPIWQRDALRRLVLNGELGEEDIVALSEICKSRHGLAEQQETLPLSKEYVPDKAAEAAVSLVSIFHHRGVNALAENQTLKFSLGLTIVYGDNGAGKTGYIRILKSACRARGQEKILGNVVSGTTPFTPVVSIKYNVGSEADSHEWAWGREDELVSRVSVFDTQCAAVYLTEKTDVAFRPFGLDLFDKLVQACKAVRARLELQQRMLSTNTVAALLESIPAGTVVANFLANISSLTKPEKVKALAQLSADEEARLALLEKSLLDLQNNDPEKLIRQLTARVDRVRALARHLKDVEGALSEEAIKATFDARTEGRLKHEEAARLRKATFSQGLLQGTGTDSWAALWEAARRFSQEQAYPPKTFPVVDDGAQCVLCQQNLDHAASHRLRQFEEFVISTVERELRSLRENFARRRKAFTELRTTTEAVEETLKELRIEHDTVADAISTALTSNAMLCAAVVSALAKDTDLASDRPMLISVVTKSDALSVEIDERIKTLRASTNDQTRKNMTAEVQELRARKLLEKHLQVVINDIERRKKFAAYSLAIDDTKTQAITAKSTAVTRAAVSNKLKKSFQDELVGLKFRHVEVELKELGGTDGVFYHKLALTRAPGVELPQVVSEGEQRCLSIAAFFAELCTADDPSGIVFDDPVSSLDYQWRNSVARRLVQESKTRQVIVFTHDVVFLLALQQYAEELGVEPLDQHVRRLFNGTGVCTEELPWVALPVKKKIGHLNKCWQEADKLARAGHQEAYEKEATYLYGLLREAWERALEEVLLGGIVERYRPGVQTQQIAKIADITPQDCKTLETAMSKCSTWLPGHDKAAAARAPVPAPTELLADIEALGDWVTAIRKRRG